MRRFWSLPPPALRERGHGSLACRGIVVHQGVGLRSNVITGVNDPHRDLARSIGVCPASACGTKRRLGNVRLCAACGPKRTSDQRLPNSRFMSRRPSLGLWFGRRSRLRHQEPHNRDSKQAYRCHTQKCCRPIKVRGDEPKECSAERSTKS